MVAPGSCQLPRPYYSSLIDAHCGLSDGSRVKEIASRRCSCCFKYSKHAVMESVAEMMQMYVGNEGWILTICLPLFMSGLRAADAQLVGHMCI